MPEGVSNMQMTLLVFHTLSTATISSPGGQTFFNLLIWRKKKVAPQAPGLYLNYLFLLCLGKQCFKRHPALLLCHGSRLKITKTCTLQDESGRHL